MFGRGFTDEGLVGRDQHPLTPKKQPPRKLSGKRTVENTELWREALPRPPMG